MAHTPILHHTREGANYEGDRFSQKLQNSPFFHFSNLRFSLATWCLRFEDLDGFYSSNAGIKCKAYIAHALIGLSINHSLIKLVISLI